MPPWKPYPARSPGGQSPRLSPSISTRLFLVLTLALAPLLGDVIPRYEDDAKRQIWDIRFALRKQLNERFGPSIARIVAPD
jgi:hypothetical protein